MAAQGFERKFSVCDRCFASVPLDQAFCPECGAPMPTENPKVETSDAAVYTELARANLLRMRGEYKQAEEQCLNILKRFPNNASANTLLGDISAEQDDLAQAVQWYELSLDILPDDEAVKKKLKSVRDRIEVRETANTVNQIGLANRNVPKLRFAAMIAIPILVLAVFAYLVGTKQGEQRGRSEVVNPPVVVPDQTDDQNQGTSPSGTSVDNRAATTNTADSGGDLSLFKKLTGVAGDAGRVLAVTQDPRDSRLTIAFTASDDDYKAVGARLARSAFDIAPDALVATIRAMRGGTLIFTADALRTRMNETETNTWQQQNQDAPRAWVDYVLTNPWSASTNGSEVAQEPAASDESTGAASSPDDSTPDQEDKKEPASSVVPTRIQGPPTKPADDSERDQAKSPNG